MNSRKAHPFDLSFCGVVPGFAFGVSKRISGGGSLDKRNEARSI